MSDKPEGEFTLEVRGKPAKVYEFNMPLTHYPMPGESVPRERRSIFRILWWIVYGLFIILMWVVSLAALLALITFMAMTFGGVGWCPE